MPIPYGPVDPTSPPHRGPIKCSAHPARSELPCPYRKDYFAESLNMKEITD
jgi:hypothetical protein